jgi:hypothetical protein
MVRAVRDQILDARETALDTVVAHIIRRWLSALALEFPNQLGLLACCQLQSSLLDVMAFDLLAVSVTLHHNNVFEARQRLRVVVLYHPLVE